MAIAPDTARNLAAQFLAGVPSDFLNLEPTMKNTQSPPASMSGAQHTPGTGMVLVHPQPGVHARNLREIAAYVRAADTGSIKEEWLASLDAAYARVNAHDGLVMALCQISLCSQNSASSKDECGRIARKALAALPTPYNAARIAWELERTALGDGFYGNALSVAKDMPGVTDDDRALLDRYATGRNSGTDHVALQDLALRLDRAAIAKATGSAS